MKIHIAAGHPNFETVALPGDKHARLQMLSDVCPETIKIQSMPNL